MDEIQTPTATPRKKAPPKPKPEAPKPEAPKPEAAPVRSPRPYTGFDGYRTKRQPGLEYLVAAIAFLTGNRVWNNGTLGIRPIRGGTAPSVHGTGRAADLSWRDMRDGKRGTGATRADAEQVADWLVRHEERLGVELVLDYFPRPFGRGWRCDREAWTNYTTKTVAGAPGGDWLHVEISPAMASNLHAMMAAVDDALRTDS